MARDAGESQRKSGATLARLRSDPGESRVKRNESEIVKIEETVTGREWKI